MSNRIESDAELDRVGRLGTVTFNFKFEHWSTWTKNVPAENHRVLRRDGKIVAALGLYFLRQWYGGRPVSMAGVALVCVDPTERARGLSTELLSETLNELHREGVALSTLYPSTQKPYRRVGYEQGGHFIVYEHDFYAARERSEPLTMSDVSPLESATFESLDRVRAERENGVLERSTAMWNRLFEARDNPTPVRGYLLGPAEAPEGYVVCYDRSDRQYDRILLVKDMVANTPAAASTLWDFLHSHRSVCDKIRWPGGPNDPILLASEECRPNVSATCRWMSRIVHVQNAIQQRGFLNDLSAPLWIEIDDPTVPENSGVWKLEIRDSQATLERTSTGDTDRRIHCTIGGLSALYTGLFDATTLARRGLMSGSVNALAAASACFAGPPPWMPDAF